MHVRPAIVKAPPDPLTAIVFAVAAELGDLVAPLHTSPVADEAFPLRAPAKVVVDKVFELGLYVIPASYKTCWAVVLALSRKATYWSALVALRRQLRRALHSKRKRVAIMQSKHPSGSELGSPGYRGLRRTLRWS